MTGSTAPGHGTRSVSADGSYSYTPDPGFSGIDTFQNTVTDDLGRTATATVTVTVSPTAAPDTATTLEGSAVSVDPTVNDQGTGLAVTSVGAPAPGEGATSIVGGQVVYTPPAGFVGTVTVPYTVTDVGGGTATSTITFTVDPPAPSAADDAGTVAAGSTLSVSAPGVLGNDSGTALTVTSNTTPGHGTATMQPDGSYTYRPDPGYPAPTRSTT